MARPTIVSAEETEAPTEENRNIPVTVSDDRQPVYSVVLEGKDFSSLGYTRFVKSIRVEETDDMLPLAVVELWNQNGRLSDSILFKNFSSMSVRTGYAGDALESRGRFILHKPKVIFNGAEGDIIQLVGYGEGVRLHQDGEKRRGFRNVTDSEIAKTLADEYGLEHDIQDTEDRYESVIQAGESDMVFLRRRARLHGYQVYVLDGYLHFHAPRYDDSGVVIRYRQGAGSSVTTAEVSTDSLLKAPRYTLTGYDPLTGEKYSERSDNVPDQIVKGIRGLGEGDTREWDDIVDNEGAPSQAFLVGEGHRRNLAEARRMVETFAQADRYVARGFASSIGIPKIKAAQLITVLGMGVFSGRYYVKRATHIISTRNMTPGAGLYSVSVDIVKASTRELGAVVSAQGAGPTGSSSNDNIVDVLINPNDAYIRRSNGGYEETAPPVSSVPRNI